MHASCASRCPLAEADVRPARPVSTARRREPVRDRTASFGPLGPANISGATVDAIQIIFDEGQDTGPDNFGLAVLDNIRVNDQVAGRGPGSGS